VCAMGSNRYGQLGLGHCRDASTPCPVAALSQCSATACGASFSIVICGDGVVQSCGSNELMQLGRQVPSAEPDGCKAAAAAAAFDCHFRPLCIALGPGGSWGLQAAGQSHGEAVGGAGRARQVQPPQAYLIAAGWSHGLAAVRFRGCSHVIAWGWNGHGQLGLGDTEAHAVPEDIDVFEGEEIAAMACGLMHSVVVSGSGLAYGSGCAKGGMLGCRTANCIVPTVISGPWDDLADQPPHASVNFVGCEAGAMSTLLLSDAQHAWLLASECDWASSLQSYCAASPAPVGVHVHNYSAFAVRQAQAESSCSSSSSSSGGGGCGGVTFVLGSDAWSCS
jgi:hypothetical protein